MARALNVKLDDLPDLPNYAFIGRDDTTGKVVRG
jgi:hypothetical protein